MTNSSVPSLETQVKDCSLSSEKSKSDDAESMRKSALQDNIESKGKNAYYFAHAHKANGPQWDGKVEPKLLQKEASEADFKLKQSSFDYHKSNITKYAFLDDGAKVKLYLEMEAVGDKCSEEDVELKHTATSFHLVITNFKPEPQVLSFGKLTAEISNASVRLKKDRIIVTLTKVIEENTWHTVADKGTPDHELV